MKTQLITAPAAEPLSLTQAKLHLRVDFTDDDNFITPAIQAARQLAEELTKRAFIDQTWNLYADSFPGGRFIELPYPPLSSVTGVFYTPEGQSEMAYNAANYLVDTAAEPGRIVLKESAEWPSDTLESVNGVRVEYVAGYGAAATDLPPLAIALCQLILGHLYENREGVIVGQGVSITTLPIGIKDIARILRVDKYR